MLTILHSDPAHGSSHGNATEESVKLAHEIFNRVFRGVPERMQGKF
jgi:hypothetical protein